MEKRTRSACNGLWFRAVLLLVLPGALTCRPASPPSLAHALAVKGAPEQRAKAFMRVAIEGRAPERARAALLWGLYACDARAPATALAGFEAARPRGGLAHLAARRLEEALEASDPSAASWRAALAAPWLLPEDRERLSLLGAERLAGAGQAAAAAALLPALDRLQHGDLGRALAVVAASGGQAAEGARRRLAVEFPTLFEAVLPGSSLSRIEATFNPQEGAAHGRAWLDSGEPEAALKAAARAGREGFPLAAQAALKLRRPSAALAWATRGGERCASCWLERAEAYRQLAWSATPARRTSVFTEMLGAARRGRALLSQPGAPEGHAEVLIAEALVELGKFAEALPHLTSESAQSQPRWEWVCRRLVFLEARRRPPLTDPPPELGKSTRGRRLAEYWLARIRARRGEVSGLQALAASGFPDLPAQWASERLGRSGVAFVVGAQPPAVAPAPAWAADLLNAGRVADAVVAWRADLESSGGTGAAWLGLLALADMPPLDGIPLLVRADPRLLSGPWQGVPRALLERYLPLPWRSELEAAARRTGVPPWVLAGLVRQESAWDPHARSAAGALGLTQLLAGPADELARQLSGFPRRGDLLDPERNLTLGAAHLVQLRRAFGGSWTAALAAYNSGERRVREVWDANGRRDGPEFVESLEIPETWDYVHRVVLLAEGYRVLYWPDGRAYPWT